MIKKCVVFIGAFLLASGLGACPAEKFKPESLKIDENDLSAICRYSLPEDCIKEGNDIEIAYIYDGDRVIGAQCTIKSSKELSFEIIFDQDSESVDDGLAMDQEVGVDDDGGVGLEA